MNSELFLALKKLIERIERDQSSGLLNRETIRAKNELRLLLSRMGVSLD